MKELLPLLQATEDSAAIRAPLGLLSAERLDG